MEDFPLFGGKRAIEPSQINDGNYDAIIICTDHDDIDYALLVEAGVPIIDTRNAIERRGLSMDNVTKA